MSTSRRSDESIVEMVTGPTPPVGVRWMPAVSTETVDLLQRLALPKESSDRLRAEALEVLGRCVPPSSQCMTDTGLAVGYVQSGKTLSFTTVAALARDNGYRLVIVIAGISTSLLTQSTERLIRDLGLDGDNRGWNLFESRLLKKAEIANARERLRASLDTWKAGVDVPFSWMRRTALVVAMKHHGHLERVRSLLEGIDLRKVPTLIIDDEADQASLNAAVRLRDESKTYTRIRQVRECLPHHTFLQYTATPQAPLLLNIIDSLSPRFAEVLTPGPEYVGGKDFFLKEGSKLIRKIPDEELPREEPAVEAPASLLEALRVFFIGAAAGLLNEHGKGNRSMLVHPSQERVGHSEYYSWVMAVKGEWAKLLSSPQAYPQDRAELLGEFAKAYDDIAETASDLPPKEELLNQALPWTVANTVVQEINARAGETPKVNWKSNFAHILVGGQAMDRGFTVEGLTVTYMPRSLGVGNADTIQQRARFFGYKRRYLGYCRVFLEARSIEAYRRYVAHEEDVRARLIAHRATGMPLTEWKRMFFLDQSMKPTRSSVLDLEYFRSYATADEWYTPKRPYVTSEMDDLVAENRRVVQAFRERVKKEWRLSGPSGGNAKFYLHETARLPLRLVFEECLLKLRFSDPDDSRGFTYTQLLLSGMLEAQGAQECLVYVMSRGDARMRSVKESGEIKNLFQGAAPSAPRELVGSVYPGDRKLADAVLPTVQIHILDITQDDSGAKSAEVIAENVPTVAIYLPSGSTGQLLVQPQPTQAL